ncbi:hypothetical protein J4206_01455 [Candidatus Woesearchaeota archaeon]|nr:hypothetical protein [Candidatus Woesearchaeota archaeon]
MVNRKKRLKQGIESLEHQLELHEDKLRRAEEDDNWELADYYRKEISAKRKYMEEKQRILKKGG